MTSKFLVASSALASALVLTACNGGQPGDASARSDAPLEVRAEGKARVVVASIDTGVNPYHQFYYAGGPQYSDGLVPNAVTPEVLAEFDIGPECQLAVTRTGDFAADYQADVDSGLWRQAEVCEFVWFKGTNLLSASFSAGSIAHMPDDDGDTHGVGVSAAVLNANPEAIVLSVEGMASPDGEAMSFTHPGVDIITTSYGLPGSLPIPGHVINSYTGVWGNGKLHFGACDNTPAISSFDTTCGPWWSIGISGVEETAENEPGESSLGRQPLSGTVPDFVADFTQTLPYCALCEDGYRDGVGGTSFATPRSAGIASKILLDARRQLGHVGGIIKMADGDTVMAAGNGINITNWQIRRALEQAAWIPEMGDQNPGADDALPIIPQIGFLQIGWGILTTNEAAGVITNTKIALGLEEGEVPSKGLGYCEFQTGIIQLRKIYWDNLNIDSETFLNAPAEDPFIYC